MRAHIEYGPPPSHKRPLALHDRAGHARLLQGSYYKRKYLCRDHPKISIISTVYNTGPYLRPAVESILAQTFTDFELLLVDDGSHDGCGGSLPTRWPRQDARIRVFHQANGGPAQRPQYRAGQCPAATTSASSIPTTSSSRTMYREAL